MCIAVSLSKNAIVLCPDDLLRFALLKDSDLICRILGFAFSLAPETNFIFEGAE